MFPKNKAMFLLRSALMDVSWVQIFTPEKNRLEKSGPKNAKAVPSACNGMRTKNYCLQKVKTIMEEYMQL